MVTFASSFRFFPKNLVSRRRLLARDHSPQNLPRYEQQNPIMVNNPLSLFFHHDRDKEGERSDGGKPDLIVPDILSKTREINIFASLTRDIESVSARLNNEAKNTTVLAPTNTAVQQLPRKPWEDPDDYEMFGTEGAYAGVEGESRAARNLRRFVEAHLVPQSPWPAKMQVETLGGGKIHWDRGEDGKVYIQPGNIEVDTVATKVSNGQVWILKGVINYA
jgi:uncharacterized surface protein with fasciclin (FAS1) repeats